MLDMSSLKGFSDSLGEYIKHHRASATICIILFILNFVVFLISVIFIIFYGESASLVAVISFSTIGGILAGFFANALASMVCSADEQDHFVEQQEIFAKRIYQTIKDNIATSDGIMADPGGMTGDRLKTIINNARSEIIIHRTLIQGDLNIPKFELVNALIRGCHIRILIPNSDNNYVLTRLNHFNSRRSSPSNNPKSDYDHIHTETIRLLREVALEAAQMYSKQKHKNINDSKLFVKSHLEVKEHSCPSGFNFHGNEYERVVGILWSHEISMTNPQLIIDIKPGDIPAPFLLTCDHQFSTIWIDGTTKDIELFPNPTGT